MSCRNDKCKSCPSFIASLPFICNWCTLPLKSNNLDNKFAGIAGKSWRSNAVICGTVMSGNTWKWNNAITSGVNHASLIVGMHAVHKMWKAGWTGSTLRDRNSVSSNVRRIWSYRSWRTSLVPSNSVNSRSCSKRWSTAIVPRCRRWIPSRMAIRPSKHARTKGENSQAVSPFCLVIPIRKMRLKDSQEDEKLEKKEWKEKKWA